MGKKIIGVYKITNTLNSKVYIGSSIDINSRWREHKRQLKNNKHHSPLLQNSWNKYGEINFEFSIIEECNIEDIIEREQYYLDLYKSYNKNTGFNISKNALAPMMGRKHSKETLEKLSEGVKNRDSSCWNRGEDKHNSKIRNEDIIEIKRMIYEGYKIKDIAEKFNVEANTITQIKTGERWSHIKTEYDDMIIQTPKQKLTEENIIEIKKLLIQNELNITEIANIFNVTFGMISSIKNLRNHKNIGEEFNSLLNDRVWIRKLNKNNIFEIKKLFEENKSDEEIAKIYNVTRSNISYIRNNKSWEKVV